MPEENIPIDHNSEEVQDIITAVPSWILRRGITLIFTILIGIILLAAFIRYPDVVTTSLRVNSLNSPKAIICRQSGKLVKLLVQENRQVSKDEPLAFIESSASHEDVLALHHKLLSFRNELFDQGIPKEQNFVSSSLNLGELQAAYQSFYQMYIQFLGTLEGGHYLKQRNYLQKDIAEIGKLKQQIEEQQEIQKKEYANAQQEYNAYKTLIAKGVISTNEFKQEENKYLASKYPLQQSNTSLLNNNSALNAKQKEILDLDNTIAEQKSKFVQALNVILNETEVWMMKYVIPAPIAGKLSYAGILQENQNVNAGDELFIVNPGNANFFGEVEIPQYNMGKIRKGEKTLVKLHSFPYEQYGLIRGRISYLSDVALKDSVFIAKIDFERFENKDPNHKIILKNGMMADAEIITEESSLLQRFLRNITKMMNSN